MNIPKPFAISMPRATLIVSMRTPVTSAARTLNTSARSRITARSCGRASTGLSVSRTSSGTIMIASRITVWVIRAVPRLACTITHDIPKPPIAPPTYFEPYMKPFARPRSSSESRSTARASTATSCSALNTVWISTAHASIRRSMVRSGIRIIDRIVSAIISCANTIHGRRRPHRGIVNASISGPNAHLNEYGNVVIASADATAAGATPWALMYAGIVTAVNPHGIPCAT